MAQQVIFLGSAPNDGTGDPLRDAFDKCNDNFSELYAAIAASGASWKSPVRAASTAAGTLATDYENGDTLDGVTLVTGDRILLKDQAAPAENGIYVIAASGAPSRAADADTGSELVNAAVLVAEGSTNADALFICTTNDPITLDTTGLTWVNPLAGGSGYTPGGTDVAVADGGTGASTAAGARTNLDVDTAIAAKPETLIIACSDETTAITTGTGKVTFRMPYAFTLTAVRASVTTAPTGSTIIIDINEGGTTILSTKLSIDASEKTSTTAASAAVISDSALADDAEITIDFDQVGSTIAGAGVKVYLIGHQ